MESICTSSMIYTVYLPLEGEYCISSRICLMLSTPLLDAASISITFMALPLVIPRHVSHSLQGLPSTGCSQLTALAKIFATLVLPVPLVPQKR